MKKRVIGINRSNSIAKQRIKKKPRKKLYKKKRLLHRNLNQPQKRGKGMKKLKSILFLEFNFVFMITCALAICALVIVLFFPTYAENHPILVRFAWALWFTVLVEITIAIILLFRYLMWNERPSSKLKRKIKRYLKKKLFK
jgi:hypothetical protein